MSGLQRGSPHGSCLSNRCKLSPEGICRKASLGSEMHNLADLGQGFSDSTWHHWHVGLDHSTRWGLSSHGRMSSSIPGFYPPAARSLPPSATWQPKNVSRHCPVSPGRKAESLLVWSALIWGSIKAEWSILQLIYLRVSSWLQTCSHLSGLKILVVETCLKVFSGVLPEVGVPARRQSSVGMMSTTWTKNANEMKEVNISRGQ